jgi:hypothetical protein
MSSRCNAWQKLAGSVVGYKSQTERMRQAPAFGGGLFILLSKDMYLTWRFERFAEPNADQAHVDIWLLTL